MTARRHPTESGFTLIETMVALAIGMVLIGALFVIVEVAMHQTQRLTDRVEATQLARTAMTRITSPLRSACIAQKFTPVKEGSNGKRLIFVSGYGSKAELGSENVEEREVLWEGSYPSTAPLVEKVYPANGGKWPSFTFSNTPKTITLAAHVLPINATTPIFRYEKYASSTQAAGESTGSTTLTPLTPNEASGLTLNEAASAAAVAISFQVAPHDNLTSEANRAAALNDRVLLAFAAPAAEATITDGPCQ